MTEPRLLTLKVLPIDPAHFDIFADALEEIREQECPCAHCETARATARVALIEVATQREMEERNRD